MTPAGTGKPKRKRTWTTLSVRVPPGSTLLEDVRDIVYFTPGESLNDWILGAIDDRIESERRKAGGKLQRRPKGKELKRGRQIR
jgi:hypothetical protein